ncbi:acetyltransferase [Xylariaceae sp. FL0662B]|nr:acetyltransferase [Xylariaceae sp. FL0662B]
MDTSQQSISSHVVPTTAIFVTDICYVRPFEKGDAEPLALEANDPEVARTLSNRFPKPYTLHDAETWINACRSKQPTVDFAICTLDGSLAGSIGLKEPLPDFKCRTREMGYLLGRRHWGKGIMTSVVSAFSKWVFKEFPDLLRLEADAFSTNIASQHVLLKAGFAQEGVRRHAVFKDGLVLDDVMFGLTREDVEG